MNRRQILIGASAITAGTTATQSRVSAADFGVVGDGDHDDAPAIQSALDQLGRQGGGAVWLPQPTVHYRIASGLKLPSHVVLEGSAPVRYPYNAGNKGACALVADFIDPSQWMIEPVTQAGGHSIPFNHVLDGQPPDGITYNCGVRNLLLTSRGTIPFGGIRMHGCPGSVVEGVSIDRVGCGLMVNYSFGGNYSVQLRSLYYGVAAWGDANANIFQIYCAQSVPWPRTVPPEYRLSFMVQMQERFADTLKLSTDDHAARPYGLLCGSIHSTSIGNAFDAVVERFPGGIFLYNAYATDFRQCYLEADAGTMACAIAASRSRFGITALHAYLSGTGSIFDFGIDVHAKVFASGILYAASFGNPPVDDGSSEITLEGVSPAMPGAPVQRGIRYVVANRPPTPLVLQSGWRNENGDEPMVRFDFWSHRVELQGTMANGRSGTCFVLPPLCRPSRRQRYIVPGGEIEIAPDGMVRVAPNDIAVSLDGIAFARW